MSAVDHAPSSRGASDPGSRRGFRPEVQGLRAVAVTLVVVYHLLPHRLTGGFIGVDVFFVISGFLITSHLVREAERTGTIALRRFWARRIRRLLPASLLVLAVSVALTALWVPVTQWSVTARQLIASALYVQNWALAADAVDYLALDDQPTLVQHFWSLSVEEQFYLLWPLLLVAALWLAARRRWRVSPTIAMAVVAGTVGVASLVFSVVITARSPQWAYFATPARLWELALGAVIALVPIALGPAARLVLGWSGLAMIAGAAVLIGPATPFPGWVAAVPTLGAAMVIVAGRSGRSWGADRLLSIGPARFVGDLSYSIYLWHWPLIVVAPYAWGAPISWPVGLAVIVTTALASWGTKMWVEDRFRRPGSGGERRAFRWAAAAMAAVVVAGLGLGGMVHRAQDESSLAIAEQAAALADCRGPGALANGCEPVVGDGLLVPALAAIPAQNSEPVGRDCQQDQASAAILSCTLGEAGADPARVIAVVGDSHATHWFGALEAIGAERGWQVLTFTKTGCPATAAVRTFEGEDAEHRGSCHDWLTAVDAAIRSDARIDQVVVAGFSSTYDYLVPVEDTLGPAARVAQDPPVLGYASLWQRWVDAGLDVRVVAAIPRTAGESVPDCLALTTGRLECATDRAEALPPDPMRAAAELVGARLIDLGDHFCDSAICYPVVGDLVVYRDGSHLTAEYALALSQALAQGLR